MGRKLQTYLCKLLALYRDNASFYCRHIFRLENFMRMQILDEN